MILVYRIFYTSKNVTPKINNENHILCKIIYVGQNKIEWLLLVSVHFLKKFLH